MKKRKEAGTYLFPWVLLIAVHFVFYTIERYTGYFFVFQQFFAICKYLSYIYGVILLTEVCRRGLEKRFRPGAQAEKADKKKKRRGARFGKKKADPAVVPAAESAPEETPEAAPAEEKKPKRRRLTEGRLRTVVTVVHTAVILLLLLRFTFAQFTGFYIGTAVEDARYGLVFIGSTVLAAVVLLVAGGWMRNLPKKPGSATAQGMLMFVGADYAVTALFLTLYYMLNIPGLTALVWILRVASLLFVLIILVGLAVSLIRKNLLEEYDYLFFINALRSGKKQSFADFLEENTGLSVKSLWSIRYAAGLLPAAVLGLAAILLLSTCVYRVDPQQQAVVYRFGQIVNDRPVDAGLHFKLPWPVDKAEIYDVARVKEVLVGYDDRQSKDNLWTQVHEEYQLLLGDGNELVSVNIKIAYVIDDLCGYVKNYADPESILTARAYELMLNKTVNTDLDTFLSVDRSGLSVEIAEDLNEFCKASGLGIHVNSVTLESIHPPVSIADVYQGVVSAGIQKTTLITNAEAARNEKISAAEQEANTLITTAKQNQITRVSDTEYEVSGFLAAAEAYRAHPDAVTWAKYLNTFETVVKDNKVYVFIGEHDLSDYMVNFSGDARVLTGSDYLLAANGSQRTR